MNYLSTIAWHGLNVLMLRHKGEGLEKATKNNAIVISAMSTCITAVALLMEGQDLQGIFLALLLYVGFIFLFFKFWSIQQLAGVFCLFFVFACIRVLNATVFSAWIPPDSLVFVTWETIAMITFVTRVR